MSDRLDSAIRELVAAIRAELPPPRADEPERLLDVDEARKLLGGIARSTLYQLMERGELRSLTIGRRRLIPWSAIVDLVGKAR